MRIVAISDTHMEESKVQIPECDLLIHAGDFDLRTLDHLEQLNDWFYNQPAKKIVWIAGNHDFYCEKLDEYSINEIVNCATYLENNSVTINGIKIWGSPYSVIFHNWAFMLPDNELAKIWATIPKDTDIVITHGPSYGILDQVCFANGDFKENVGSISLREKIKEIQPTHFVCGHIHSARGIYQDAHTVYINASLMNDYYKLENEPIIIDYENENLY